MNVITATKHFARISVSLLALVAVASLTCPLFAQAPDIVRVHDGERHLRAFSPREWSEFPEQADDAALDLTFRSQTRNASDWTLTVRQQDVKQSWSVTLNGKQLGRLVADEKDLRTDLRVPAGTIEPGDNHLRIEQVGRELADDILVGPIELASVSPAELRNLATVQVEIQDPNRQPMPGRITIVDSEGTLVPVGIESGNGLAVREGVIYTSTGIAEFGVAPGRYRVYATRGFEYGVDSAAIEIAPGQLAKRTLSIRSEVDTRGWISCDTHIHSLTHSGHGDATIDERIVTLAGEGIDFAISTEHNKHVDYSEAFDQSETAPPFSTVIGNEVTTKNGHFNIFPVRNGAAIPDHTQTDWRKLLAEIYATPNVRVAILNHGRDLHAGFRPFSPRHHISLSGENLDGRPTLFNAMELINSGAVQTDPTELFMDWCGLLNRGYRITPVGSSDSHDVSRFIVGQGRTYVRYPKDQSDNQLVRSIDVDEAVEAFVAGKVLVSYGLLVDVTVNESFGPGDLARIDHQADSISIRAHLRCPSWGRPTEVALYLGGRQARVATIDRKLAPGDPVDQEVRWTIPNTELAHDQWVCVVARGQGIDAPYWPTAKPYQPDSIEFAPYTFAISGPVRIDGDCDGRYSSAYEYAHRLIDRCEGETARVIEQLESYDRAVAIQAAAILWAQSDDGEPSANALENSSDSVRYAFSEYRRARRQSISARLEENE